MNETGYLPSLLNFVDFINLNRLNYSSKNMILNHARLPVPPHPHLYFKGLVRVSGFSTFFKGVSIYSVVFSKATRKPLFYKGRSWPKAIFRDAPKRDAPADNL